MPTSSAHEDAESLAAQGQWQEGLRLLEDASEAGDANAQFALGTWLGRGEWIAKDFARARQLFGQAAAAGHDQADVIFTNFLGNGTGGPRDWPGAVDRLRARAKQDARARFECDLLDQMALSACGDPKRLPDAQLLSADPYIALYPGLFSQGECAYLAVAAGPFLQPATVIDNATGKAIRNPIRTSDTAILTAPLESLVVHALNRRLAAVTRTQPEQGEPLQVLRYQPGQEYKTHIDAIPSLDNQRVLTALVYLNDAFEGGETRFVAIDGTVRGRTGSGLVFRNVDQEGRPDKRVAHCGRPVTSGFKLLASRWIRERPFTP